MTVKIDHPRDHRIRRACNLPQGQLKWRRKARYKYANGARPFELWQSDGSEKHKHLPNEECRGAA
jgi:hypothetical protein